MIVDKTTKHVDEMIFQVPAYPQSRPFNDNDIGWYTKFYATNDFSPYVDIHPHNMLTWLNFHQDLCISQLNGVIILSYTNVLDNNNRNIIPLAKVLDDTIISEIMCQQRVHNHPMVIKEIPAMLCSCLDPNKWNVENDRDSWEYILDCQFQSTLCGSEFRHHRNNISYFDRMHKDDILEVIFCDSLNKELADEIYQFIKQNAFTANTTRENKVEPIIIQQNLKKMEQFNKKAFIIKINGNIKSFALVAILSESTAAINHLKVDYSLHKLFNYSIYTLAKILNENGIKEMNIEQDLGIEGLRMFKERLKPSRYLEKRTISAKE